MVHKFSENVEFPKWEPFISKNSRRGEWKAPTLGLRKPTWLFAHSVRFTPASPTCSEGPLRLNKKNISYWWRGTTEFRVVYMFLIGHCRVWISRASNLRSGAFFFGVLTNRNHNHPDLYWDTSSEPVLFNHSLYHVPLLFWGLGSLFLFCSTDSLLTQSC